MQHIKAFFLKCREKIERRIVTTNKTSMGYFLTDMDVNQVTIFRKTFFIAMKVWGPLISKDVSLKQIGVIFETVRKYSPPFE